MKRLVAPVALALGVVGSVSAQGTIATVDPQGGSSLSMAIGTDGLALIAYMGAQGLKAAHCSNTACTAATLSVLDPISGTGSRSVLAIGADGRGIIAYRLGQTVVKVAHCDDLACSSASVRTIETTSPSGGAIGLAIGADGLPLIGYVATETFPTPSRLHVAHCTTADCSSFTVNNLANTAGDVLLEKAANGLGLIVTSGGAFRCVDAACSAVTAPPPQDRLPIPVIRSGLDGSAAPADGRALIASNYYESQFPIAGHADVPLVPTDIYEARLYRCSDATCTSQALVLRPSGTIPDVALQANGLPLFAYRTLAGIVALRTCHDAGCASSTETCVLSGAGDLSVQQASDGQPLIALNSAGLAVAHGTEPCVQPVLGVADTSVFERPGAQASFPVTLSVATQIPVTVGYFTLPGTALAGEDYVATSGTLTFPPGTTSASVLVPIIADAVIEQPETFSLVLNNPTGATMADAVATGTITDPTPDVLAGTCAAVEGDNGTTPCSLSVSLSEPTPQTVTVDYATAPGTALSGTDFLSTSGTLTFEPGAVSRTVTVSIVGDTTVELDETFFVNLANAVNGVIVDDTGEGLVVDDDAVPFSVLELTHGSAIRADLAADAGPAADEDAYRLGQGPYSSWEVIVDEASGDIAPGFVLDRLAEDNSTVLQTGALISPLATAKALRWERRSALPETRQHIRVRSASCSTGCGADDTYRLRAYETTGSIPRFNNSGSQVTVLILQNPTSQTVNAHADFWDASGNLLATSAVTLQAKQVFLSNTSSLAALNGRSGTITVTHDGPYGALVGKTVALEPTTGFSFDSPMLVKPR